jgi:hypothetical protein
MQFNAADLAGKTVGQVFFEAVINDPSVQAAGERLCSRCRIFEPLFKDGKFPIVIRRSKSFGTQSLPSYVNVGYSKLKERWRRLPRGGLSAPNRTSPVPTPDRPPNKISWHDIWPVVFDAQEIVQTLSSEEKTNAGYWRHPFKNLIEDAVAILADRHWILFEPLRRGDLVAEGIFRNSGQELPLPSKEWGRPDRYLDVQNSDLLCKEAKTLSVAWQSVTLQVSRQDKGLKPDRLRPVDRVLEEELRERGLADGRHGQTDHQIACALVDPRLTGEALRQAIDRKRKQLKRYYERRRSA